MKRDEMHQHLAELDPAGMLPIWVISHGRAQQAPLLEAMVDWPSWAQPNILVRASQSAAYQVAYPDAVVYDLPDDVIDSCGAARWGAADLALAAGHGQVLMMDDDVLKLDFLFERPITRGPNAGKAASGATSAADHAQQPDLAARILLGMSDVARQVFAAHPRAMIGGAIKRHMSFSEKNHATQYVLNGAVTPRQAMVWNLERMHAADVYISLDDFGVTGEDLAVMDAVLAAGGDAFAMPSFAYDHWPESVNITASMIRNASNAAALHAHEWEALQRYPIRDYLRVKRSVVDGSYEWGDVDWVKLNKLRGTKSLRVPWGADLL